MNTTKTDSAITSEPENNREFYLSVILALQITTIFIAAPLITSNGGNYRWILNIFLTSMALISVFIFAHPLKHRVALFNFALCLTGLGLGPMFSQHNASKVVVGLSGLIFCTNVNWIVAHKVFTDGTITLHRIRGAVVIYLNIALSFALLDSLMATFIPEAYSGLPTNMNDTIGSMIYFSLTTLTTTGYGDIVAVHPFARSLATLEAVVGQFYMGTLIATLVGLHVSHRQNQSHTRTDI
jgi:voltage-gated potassium channel Kch